MSRSPRPDKKHQARSKRGTQMRDRLMPVVDEPQVTAQPADETVKMHLDTGCSWIRPVFPEDT